MGTEINSPDSNDSGFQASGEKTPALTPQTPGVAQVWLVLPLSNNSPDCRKKTERKVIMVAMEE